MKKLLKMVAGMAVIGTVIGMVSHLLRRNREA